MNEDIIKKLEEQDKKLDEIYRSVEKMRRYFFWTLIVTIAVIILPLVGLMFVLPAFLSSLGTNLNL